MRHIARACGLLALALAGCASVQTREPDVPAVLRPYTEAARFLLPGHSSLSFQAADLSRVAAGLPPEAPRAMLVARCGSGFEAPKGKGYGGYRGVEVFDFGPNGLHHYLREEGAPTTWLRGAPVWNTPGPAVSRDRVASWRAAVDDRFLVCSSARDELERALACGGDLEALLQPFPAVHAIAGDVEAVVCALPRPDDAAGRGRPVPIETIVVCIRRSPRCLVIYHRKDLPLEFTDWYRGPKVGRTTEQQGAWLVSSFALGADDAVTQLMIDVLFGQAIAD